MFIAVLSAVGCVVVEYEETRFMIHVEIYHRTANLLFLIDNTIVIIGSLRTKALSSLNSLSVNSRQFLSKHAVVLLFHLLNCSLSLVI